MSRSIEKRINKSSEKNKKLFLEYTQHISGKVEFDSLRSVLIRLIEHNNHKDLEKLTWQDIESFLETFDNLNYFNNQVSYLKTFFTYFESISEISFNIELFDKVKFSAKDIEETSREAYPLTFEEVIKLRNILEENKKYQSWIVFELAYYYGLKNGGEVGKFNTSKYDTNSKRFNIKNYDNYESSEIIQYLISKNALSKKKRDSSGIYYHIKELERYLGRSLIFKDIKATRDNNFFKCPRCGNSFENKPNNWVVYEYEVDKSQWIVCKTVCFKEVKQ